MGRRSGARPGGSGSRSAAERLERIGPTGLQRVALRGPGRARNEHRVAWRCRRVLFLGLVAVALTLAAAVASVDPIEADDLSDGPLATSYVCAADVVDGCDHRSALSELSPGGEARVFVPYEAIPPALVDAVVATEDRRFFEHDGIDAVGLARAAGEQVKDRLPGLSGSSQGGSTITQQYIKLISGDDAVTVGRKSRELVRAVELERRMTAETGLVGAAAKRAMKERLLEAYLNRVWFGRRSYGVQAAALNYFGKDVEELTTAEAAYLAGLIRNPAVADHTANPTEATRRRDTTIEAMFEAGFLGPAERAEALAEPWTSIQPRGRSRGLGSVVDAEFGTDYFVAAIHNELDRIFPDDRHARSGVRVYTTLDRDLQRLAHRSAVDGSGGGGAGPVALITLDAQGRVLAMIGGADWERSEVNRALGVEVGNEGVPAGGLFLPIVQAAYLESGGPADARFASPPRMRLVRDGRQFLAFGGGSPAASSLTVHDAVVRSSNTAMVQAIDEATPAITAGVASRLGIESELDPVPTLALGLDRVSVVEMASVYATFDRGGRALEPVLIERIEDGDGRILCWFPTEPGDCDEPSTGERPDRRGDPAISVEVAAAVTAALVDAVDEGTGQAARLGGGERAVPVAGKTGYSAGRQDAWFVGSACRLTTAVWRGSGGTGSTAAVEPTVIWQRYMDGVLAAGGGLDCAAGGAGPADGEG